MGKIGPKGKIDILTQMVELKGRARKKGSMG